MRYFLIFLAILSLAFALHVPRTDSQAKYKRGRGGSGERPVPRVRPRPPSLQPSRDRPDTGDHEYVHKIARKEPKFAYPKSPFTTREVNGKPATGGPTVFERPDGAGWLGNLYLGENDASVAKGIKLSQELYPELEGRQFTILSREPTQRDLKRQSSLQRFKEAQAARGMEAETPPTWNTDKGWWKGLTVEYETKAAQHREYVLQQVSKKLEVWSSQPEGQRFQIHDNTRPQQFLRSPRDQALPRWARKTGRPLPYPVTPQPGAGGRTLYDRMPDPRDFKRVRHSKRDGFHSISYQQSDDAAEVKHLKRDAIDTISEGESKTGSGAQDSPDTLSTDFQEYLEAYEAAQGNASDLIFPILDEMLNGTNSSIVYDAAWSIYADLTGTSPMIVGPFMYGMHSLNWIEDQIFANSTNTTSGTNMTESQFQTDIMSMHAVLLDLYSTAWTKSVAALNATGLLDDMQTLSAYLSTNDTSVMPAGYSTWIDKSYDSRYFTVYNQTM